MSCSNNLEQELKFIREIFYDNRYLLGIVLTNKKVKIAKFCKPKCFDPDKCPVSLRLPGLVKQV